jgi:hypothetical protein
VHRNDLVDLFHQADGLGEDSDDLLVVDNVVLGQSAALRSLSHFLANSVSMSVNKSTMLGRDRSRAFAPQSAWRPTGHSILARQRGVLPFMPTTWSKWSLPRLLAFLKKEAPRATLRTSPIPLENPGAAMVSGDVDAAAGFFDNLTTGFRQSLLFRERYFCAVRANHPKFRTGMTLEGFKIGERAMADATGMGTQ